jgi:hypothetical protein
LNNIQYDIKQKLHSHDRATSTTSVVQATVWRAFGIGSGKQQQLLQTISSIDSIGTSVEHSNTQWKSDGLPCHQKGIY